MLRLKALKNTTEERICTSCSNNNPDDLKEILFSRTGNIHTVVTLCLNCRRRLMKELKTDILSDIQSLDDCEYVV